MRILKDDKLSRFFSATNFSEDNTIYFKDASVKEVLLNKKESRMTMVIEIDNLPIIDVFNELYEKVCHLVSLKVFS